MWTRNFAKNPSDCSSPRTAKALSRSFDDALAERGGSLPSWLVLLSRDGAPSQRSIAAEVGVEGPTLTHHLNRMEADGLVTRQRDPQNRRVHQVELTERARRVRLAARRGRQLRRAPPLGFTAEN